MSLSPHPPLRDPQTPPLATLCSAPAAPSPSVRTMPRLRSSQSPVPPAPAPRPFSPPPPAPRAPRNYLSSSPPISPAQSPMANISANQLAPSCSTCSPPRSKSVPLRSAPRPAQSSPPDEYRKLLPHSPTCPKPSAHPSTASKSQIPNLPCSPSPKYPPARLQSCPASRENISSSRYSPPSPRAPACPKLAPAAPAPPPAPKYPRSLHPAPTHFAETSASSGPPPSSDTHSRPAA